MNEIKKDKNYSLYLSGLIDEDELMRRISLYEISSHPYEDKVVRQLDTNHPQYDPKTRGIRPKGFAGRGFPNNLPDPIKGLEGPKKANIMIVEVICMLTIQKCNIIYIQRGKYVG